MQSFDTNADDAPPSSSHNDSLVAGRIDDLRPGACVSVELPNGDELAVCNVNGEYYAIDNFCPHKGAPLSEGSFCGHIIECGWHGWQFDVRSGECLTVRETLRTYRVKIEEGLVKIDL
jgi:nitrite reductase/ring-hydroxylating ferredoxin subunit